MANSRKDDENETAEVSAYIQAAGDFTRALSAYIQAARSKGREPMGNGNHQKDTGNDESTADSVLRAKLEHVERAKAALKDAIAQGRRALSYALPDAELVAMLRACEARRSDTAEHLDAESLAFAEHHWDGSRDRPEPSELERSTAASYRRPSPALPEPGLYEEHLARLHAPPRHEPAELTNGADSGGGAIIAGDPDGFLRLGGGARCARPEADGNCQPEADGNCHIGVRSGDEALHQLSHDCECRPHVTACQRHNGAHSLVWHVSRLAAAPGGAIILSGTDLEHGV